MLSIISENGSGGHLLPFTVIFHLYSFAECVKHHSGYRFPYLKNTDVSSCKSFYLEALSSGYHYNPSGLINVFINVHVFTPPSPIWCHCAC